MDVLETDFERVLSKLFDDEKNPNNITARRLVKKIAPYVGRDSLELQELEGILDPNANNPHVNRDTFKAALIEWTDNLKNGKNSCFVEEMSLVTRNSGTDQYTTFSSLSSNSYRERITELQNELAEKDHLIRNMKKQLEHSTQLTQQHEDTLTQMALERDKLINKLAVAQNSSNTCEALKKEYAEQAECLNVYKEKCISLESIIDSIKKDNHSLRSKIVKMENEKHSLTQLLAAANEDREKIENQLSTSYMDLEMLISEHIQFKERINEQEQIIENLNTIKHSLEVDLQNSINKSVHLSHYMEKCDETFDDCIAEDLGSQLQSNTNNKLNVESIKPTRRHSEGSIRRESIKRKDLFQDNQVTSTPRNHMSLMEELQQAPIPSPTVNTTDYQKFSKPLKEECPHPIACEAESTSDTYFKFNNNETDATDSAENIFNFENSLFVNENTCVVQHVKVFTEKETQTEVSGALAHNNNMLVLRDADGGQVVCIQHNGIKKKVKKVCTGILDKLFVWGTCICISYACLHLYNTMRYCHNIRQGTAVHVYPSEWFTLGEILNSIFEVRNTGPAPI